MLEAVRSRFIQLDLVHAIIPPAPLLSGAAPLRVGITQITQGAMTKQAAMDL